MDPGQDMYVGNGGGGVAGEEGGRIPLEGKQRLTGKDSLQEEGTLFLKR